MVTSFSEEHNISIFRCITHIIMHLVSRIVKYKLCPPQHLKAVCIDHTPCIHTGLPRWIKFVARRSLLTHTSASLSMTLISISVRNISLFSATKEIDSSERKLIQLTVIMVSEIMNTPFGWISYRYYNQCRLWRLIPLFSSCTDKTTVTSKRHNFPN